MVAEERRRVEAFRKRAWSRVVLYGLGATVLPLVGLVRLGQHYARGGEVTPTIAFAGMVVLLLAPFALLGMLGFWSRARAYTRDLEGNKVMRFVGSLSSFDSLGLDPDLAMLTRRGFVEAEPGTEQELVLLPESRELLYANKRWAPPGLVLHVGRVALPPESPLRVALPDDVEAQSSENLDVARRRLTTAEIDELTRHAEALGKPGRVFWVLGFFSLMALISWQAQSFQWPPRPATLPLVLAAFGFASLLLAKRVFLARRLARDSELGWVLTVDHPSDVDPSGDTDLPAQGVETLLHAQLDWTVNRRPASWRRFGGRNAK